MRTHNPNGFTIVELLVVAAIVGILMSLISIYFSQQAKVTRETQALQEARIKARMVAEMVVQDLQTAGSSVGFRRRGFPNRSTGLLGGRREEMYRQTAQRNRNKKFMWSMRPRSDPTNLVGG